MVGATIGRAASPRRTIWTRSLPLDKRTASQLPTSKSCAAGKSQRLPEIEALPSLVGDWYSPVDDSTVRIWMPKPPVIEEAWLDAAEAAKLESSHARQPKCSMQWGPSHGQPLG